MPPLVYVDANIFVYLKEGFGELPDRLTDLVMTASGKGSPPLATSELSLAELLVKPLADRRDELIDQYDSWIVDGTWIAVGPVTRDALWYAAVLRSLYRNVKLPDAIHLSTAFGLGCRYFLTADTGLKGTYELSHTRYGLTRGPLKLEVLRPETEVLQKLQAEIAEQ